MKLVLSFFLVFILCGVSARAQQTAISGMVTDASGRLSNCVIKNISNNSIVKTNVIGFFSIPAAAGDTLTAELPEYLTDTIVLKQQDNLVITLIKPKNALREVDINARVASPAEVYKSNKEEYKKIYFDGDKSHIVEYELEPMGIGVALNVDKIYNAVSKKGKDARRLQKNFTDDYQNALIEQHFNKKIVAKITGLAGARLDDFMLKYHPAYKDVSKEDDYQVMQYIKRMYAVYKVTAPSQSPSKGVLSDPVGETLKKS